MNRTIFYLFLLLLFACTQISCVQKDKQSYVEYYMAVNQAENLIYDLKYEEALSVYTELLDAYPHIFYKDLHNACLCALKLHNHQLAYELAKNLVMHGYELTDFEDLAFEELRNSEYWTVFLEEYTIIHNNYLSGLDNELREKYIELGQIDQSEERITRGVDYQDSIFYNQALQFVILIRENGFPRWFINKDDSINNYISAMFGHNCALYNEIKEKTRELNEFTAEIDNSKVLDTICMFLREAVLDGWLFPQDYIQQTTLKSKQNLYGKLNILKDYDKETIDIDFPDEQTVAINQRRDSIGLPPVSREIYQDYINNSSFKDYPFVEIKEQLYLPSPFDSLPLAIKLAMIESELVEDNIKVGTESFILTTLPGGYANVYILGL